MATYKNLPLDDTLAGLVRHMQQVEDYRESLQQLQSNWDNLTLLGQLSGVGTDMSTTRQGFHALTGALINRLAGETLHKTVQEMGGRAQVAIDILVRNLFERTADIGFLATDGEIRAFLAIAEAKRKLYDRDQQLDEPRRSLEARFAEYVAKYSVYSDIVLLNPEGDVVARLDRRVGVDASQHPFVREALITQAAYVETFGPIDLLPTGQPALVYAYRVTNGRGKPAGVLALVFAFENEMAGIFGKLVPAGDWSVVTLLDDAGRVITSSDPDHIAVGTHLTPVLDAPWRVVRFRGQEYLAVSRRSLGYQGYPGPAWTGHVMLPLQQAFASDDAADLHQMPRQVLEIVTQHSNLFGPELKGIPTQAALIQRDLNRSVWNGNVRHRASAAGRDSGFSKTLLWEISKTGQRTQDVFEQSIDNLQATVLWAELADSAFQAALAIDIMDRNLYERANDCRWWALTADFRDALGNRPREAGAHIAPILAAINDLYTVYTLLLVFDTGGRVVAVSRPEGEAWVGETLSDDWTRAVLALPDAQGYAVSDFAATPLYGNRPTYLYGAAIRGTQSTRVVGGVGIVFDAAPQFAAMLRDTLPKASDGAPAKACFAAFVTPTGQVIACSDDRLQPGQTLPLPAERLDLAPGQSWSDVVDLNGQFYAVGARASSGYREFKGPRDPYRNTVIALVFSALCASTGHAEQAEHPRPTLEHDTRHGPHREIATFRVGDEWLGLCSERIHEAVDAVGLTPLPGAEPHFAGLKLYEGQATPVFRLDGLLGAPAPIPAEAQIILLRREDGPPFGLLVDELGEIPEVPAELVKPLPPMASDRAALAEAMICPMHPPGANMVLVLSADRLGAHFLGADPAGRLHLAHSRAA
ncbi:MAG: chemotaxis protein CheW [Zoogloeaceae bacterium]|nr:chemotaxis protein CheW [Zoogloeaceae bacterium]